VDERERSPPNPAPALVDCAAFVHPKTAISGVAGFVSNPVTTIGVPMREAQP
jgi:hypothetical protein